MTGLWVLLATLLLATAAGVALRARNGRVRRGTGSGLAGWGEPGAVVLLQLSSPVCAPCRQARGVLAALAAATPGLRHVEVDVSERPELAARLGVMRTPTTVALDDAGRELLRVSGVPRPTELTAALAPALARRQG